MKKTALLNSGVSRVVATMGHMDWLVVSDAGVCAEGDSNGGGRGKRDLVIDARTVVPPELSSPSHCSEIRFVCLCDFALFLMSADRCA